MTPTIRLGRLAGVPIGAHWSVLVIVGLVGQVLAMSVLPGTAPDHSTLVYWITGMTTALLFMAGLLAHELAHAAVARHYGMRVERITLWALGGVAELRDEPPTPRADLLVALAGPVASVGVGVLFLGAGVSAGWLAAPMLLVAAASWLGLMNLLLAVFNLLPGAPLDGGRVLRGVLWWRHGDRARARESAARAGSAVGMLLIMLGTLQVIVTGTLSGLWLALIGWFLISTASAERTFGEARERLGAVPVRNVMTTGFVSMPNWSTVDDLVAMASQLRQRSFPLVDLDGRPTGVVSLGQLAGVAESDRASLRLSEIAEPAAKVPVTSPDAMLADVLTRAVGHRGGLVLVVEDGRLVGLLTGEDISRAVELARLTGVLPMPPGTVAATPGR
ncbi:MAG TPA: site-2 protease family protein [Micromonosporaceae bacterium]